MKIRDKRKPPRHVPGTRKPTASWPIQPKDIAELVAQQRQEHAKQEHAKLTDEEVLRQKEEVLRQLRKWRDDLKSGLVVVALTDGFEEQIRIAEADVEQWRLKIEQQHLKLQRGPH